MRTEHYIAELLYRYNCVAVPEFGAFLTQSQSSKRDEHSNTFYPPSKEVSFNQQLQSNDGLLLSYIANAENKSFEDVQIDLKKETDYWHRMLKLGENIKLKNIGVLANNEAGKIEFTPEEQVNYHTPSFGLAPVVATPVVREVLKEEVVALEEEIPFIITPEQRKSTSFRPLLKYAAVVLLAVATGLTGLRLYNDNIGSQQLVEQQAQEQVSKKIQEATFFNTDPVELPAISLDIITVAPKNVHHIVAGAFRVEENANKKISELKAKGYNASYIGINKYGLHQVAYDTFEDSKAGIKFLREIQYSENADAWMLSVK